MRLFGNKRMPDDLESMKIQMAIESLQGHYKWICQTDDLGAFVNGTNFMKDDIHQLFEYEKKYPNFFRNKPSYGWNRILQERAGVEQNFIDRYIMSIERKLLNYSTLRGKTNNFNKMVDLFRYYAGEFEPENVKYFEMKLFEDFPEFYQ